MQITSVNNELVKQSAKLQQKKYRDESGKFLLEGYKAIEEAYRAGVTIEKIFVIESKESKYTFCNCEIISTTQPVLKKIASTDSAPEAIAIGIQKTYDISLLQNTKTIALFEGIKDLGNLGTILRSCTAFGVDAVILFGETVDLYNPKCVRASVGNLWKTPVFNIKNIDEIKNYFSDFERIATLPKSENTIYLKDYKKTEKILVMFGSEADGLSEELKKYATKNITIEMQKSVESLNLSISAGIIFYELFK